MMSVKTILHPTDFSEESRAAFQMACSLAREYGAKLVIVHAAPIEIVYGGMVGVPMEPYPYLHTLEQHLEEMKLSCPGIVVDVHLREGAAVNEILDDAEEVHADLIVMGTHGRSGVGRILLGSIAEGVLRKARCPVLTLKGPSKVETADETSCEAAMV